MKATTPKLWLRDRISGPTYMNLRAGISVCTPALLGAKIVGDKPTIPAMAKLRFSTKPAKGFKPVWFHATGAMLWYGYEKMSVGRITPGGLADWMDRNQLLPEVRGIFTAPFQLYVKLIKAR